MAEFIHNQPRTDRDGDNNLRLVWFVPMPEAIIEDFASRFGIATVLTVFGMTELSLCIHTPWDEHRSEEHTSELQSLMRISYDVFCLKKKTTRKLLNTSVH